MAFATDSLPLLLVQLVAILAVAKALGALAARIGLTAVVGELLTGFVLGPSLLGSVAPSLQRTLAPAPDGAFGLLSFLGLLFLLTLAGLELDISLIASRVRAVTTIALSGMALPVLLGVGVGLLLPAAFLVPGGDRLVFSLFLATALSISAIPVIARVLLDLDVYHHPFGQVIVAAAMLTDAIGWVLVSIITGLARSGRIDAVSVGLTLAALAVFLVVAFTIGQRLVDVTLNRIGSADAGLGHLSVILLTTLATSAVTLWVGLEPALGAFVVGVIFAHSEALSESAIEAFESTTLGFFAPLFFAVAGLRADLGLLLDPSVLVVSVVLVVVASVGKFVGVYAAALSTGSSRWEAVSIGVGLNARGAIEIVIATLGLEFGILTGEMYTVILVVAIVTTVATPPVLRRTVEKIGGSSAT